MMKSAIYFDRIGEEFPLLKIKIENLKYGKKIF